MLTVKVLGPGCMNCKKLEAVAREAASGSAKLLLLAFHFDEQQAGFYFFGFGLLVLAARLASSSRISAACRFVPTNKTESPAAARSRTKA